MTLDESHAYCRQVARKHARSFYFASIALPPEKKRAAYAVYAFCRYADDLIDEAREPAEVVARLGQEFDAMLDGPLPFAPAFAWAVRRYGIEKSLFLDLLEGVRRDAGPVRSADWPELAE